MATTPLYLAGLLALLTLAKGQFQAEPISDICLGCICEAASNCNRTLNCQGEVCGLFRITRPYWIDANQPVIPLDNPSNPGAFERCTQDAVCAAEAVKNYMTRFAQDCNNDGRVDCQDYAAIHRLGGYGCSGYINPEFWGRFSSCMQAVANVNPDLDVRGGQLPPETQIF